MKIKEMKNSLSAIKLRIKFYLLLKAFIFFEFQNVLYLSII